MRVGSTRSRLAAVALVGSACAGLAAGGTITTIGGTGSSGYSGDGGAATSGKIDEPNGLTFAANGDLYFADCENEVVRKIDAVNGYISTVAGGGQTQTGDGGPATDGWLNEPEYVAVDSAGNMYVADTENQRIRKIAAISGIITTIAGTGEKGYSGDGGPATAAELEDPKGIVVDSSGNVIFADCDNHRIRMITPGGTISTIAGTGNEGFSGDGGPATAAKLKKPHDVAIDSADTIYVADTENHRVRKFTIGGNISTVAGTGSDGDSGDGGPAAAAEFKKPRGIFVADGGGTRLLFVVGNPASLTSSESSRKTLMESWGYTVTLIDDSDPQSAFDAAVTTADVAYVPDTVSASGAIKLTDAAVGVVIEHAPSFDEYGFSSGSGSFTGIPIDVTDDAHYISSPFGLGAVTIISAGPVQTLVYLDGTNGGGVQTVATEVGQPNDELLAVIDAGGALFGGGTAASRRVKLPWGNGSFDIDRLTNDGETVMQRAIEWAALQPRIFVADSENHRIRRFVDGGNIITIAGDGSDGDDGDGGPATSAELQKPVGIAVNADGDVFIGGGDNDRIRRVDAATGIITTYGGTGSSGYSGDGGAATSAMMDRPHGVVVDAAGDLYLADTRNHVIRKIAVATGLITLVAGEPRNSGIGDGSLATNAFLDRVSDVAIASNGDLYVASDRQHRVRKVDAVTGVITTVIGNGVELDPADSSDDVMLGEPTGVAVDSLDNVYVVDSDGNNSRVVRFEVGTATYVMVAGTGENGFSGDGGPATAAELDGPQGVFVDAAGNIYIADTKNERIRKVDIATGLIDTIAGTGSAGSSGDGGAATAAQVNEPEKLTVDASGNVYIADTENHKIRKVTAATGIITTIAGTGSDGYSGDGGPATAAMLKKPAGVAVDSDGVVYVSDTENHRVRKLRASLRIIRWAEVPRN